MLAYGIVVDRVVRSDGAGPSGMFAEEAPLLIGDRRESSETGQETGSMTIKPLGDRVVVEREEAKETTAGGIVLPDTAKDKPQKGKVIAVGDGRITKDGKRRELQVKVGELVLFTSYAGDEFKIDGGKKVLLMREDDILAVIG
jgi:chaperonin GroES